MKSQQSFIPESRHDSFEPLFVTVKVVRLKAPMASIQRLPKREGKEFGFFHFFLSPKLYFRHLSVPAGQNLLLRLEGSGGRAS